MLNTTRQLFSALRIGADSNNVRCDLLVLQGNSDPLVSDEDARSLYEAAPSISKRIVVWDDGDHCIYNHSDEKYALIADWFRDALL